MAEHKKRILFVVPKTSYRIRDFMAAADRLGVDLLFASDRCHKLAERWPELFGLPLPFNSPDKAVQKATAYLSRHPVHGIIAGDDETAVLAARIAAQAGLPFHRTEAVENARNKLAFRQTLRAAGFPTPDFSCFDWNEDPVQLAGSIHYPCVLKPLVLSGSRGVIRADDPQQFVQAFRRIRAILTSREFEHCRHKAEYRHILVESFIRGSEIAIEGILWRGQLQLLTIFDKPIPLDGPFFEETIYVMPSSLPEGVQERIRNELETICRRLGLYHGPIHAEARINSTGIYFLEVAPRTIGGLCSRVLRFGMNLSLEELVIRHALQEVPDSDALPRHPAGVMMIPIPGRGKLHAVRGIDAAKQVPGIVDIEMTIAPGNLVIPLPEGSSYLGFIFARADSRAAVIRSLQRAHRHLEFDIHPSLPVMENEAQPAAAAGSCG